MPEQNQQTTSKSSRVSQAQEELQQIEFEGSYDERVVEDQEEFDPGSLKDSNKLKRSLQSKSEPTSSSDPVSQRSGGIPEPLTEEDLREAAKLY